MLGELTITEIDSLLSKQVVGRIGCQAEDKLYVVPITYVYQEGYVYGHSHEGKKVEMMRKNSNVCFEVDTMNGLNDWQSVIIWGEYEEMESEEDKMQVYKILNNRITSTESSETMKPSYHLPNPHPHNAAVKSIAFRIKVNEKSGRYELK